MDNWRAAQEQIASQGQVGDVGSPSAMDTRDWRNRLPADSRQRIVSKIMDTLTRHLQSSGQEGLQELKKIAIKFEEKIYTGAVSQSDYLKRISMKMLTMEHQTNGANTGQNPSDQVVHGMQTQVQNQQLSMPGQSQSLQQLISQNMQGNIPAVQNSANLAESAMTNVMNQNSNMQNMQSMPNVAQNTTGNSVGPGMALNVFTNSQRLMSGRQQAVPQQQQQQSQNTQTYLYQQQFQNQLVKQNFQQGGMAHSLMQQQNLIQPNQMQTSQQGVMQSSPIQSSSIQQTQHPSVQPVTLQPQSQSVLRQQHQQQQLASLVHQQQSSISQQTLQAPQQQQANATGIQHNQMIGQQNSIPDVQQQQQQRLMGQQSNVPNLQKQMMNQHNSLSNMQPQQMGPQGNGSGLHQQSVIGSQTGNAGMQTNQHNMHMLQQPKVPVHVQQNGMSLPPKQNQQGSQQQMGSHIQTQPVPLQHMPQQSNTLLREGQQRLPTSNSSLQQQNIEQQKQLQQSQRDNPEASSNSTAQTGNVNGGDWQEEVYEKIKSMKGRYFRDLNGMLMKISNKLQQQDSQPQQPNNGQLDKLRHFKLVLERFVAFLCTNRSEIQNNHRETWPSVEKQIVHILNSNRPRRTVPQMSERQPRAQLSHMPPQDNQMNTQMQPMNHRSSMTMQPNSLTNLQHSTPVSSSQQNTMSGVQPASTLELGQTNARNSLQQIAVTSLQANTIGSPQTVNSNSLSSQSGMNTLQSNLNNSLQTNSSLIQNQHIKQEHQTLPAQQLKQMHQRQQINQMFARQQQQLMHQQPHHQHQQQAQQQQQVKQQLTTQSSGHQMSPLHQMTDSGDVKIRQQMGVKPAVFQQHHPSGQRAAYHHHQLKSGSPFPVSPPQVLQAHSPQILPHHSPQIDQQNMLTTMAKGGTPLQSASSPFVAPSPSTSLAPSPMPGESEKLNSSLLLLSNTGNMGHSQVSNVGTTVGLAIGTPGISASPLLAEFSSLDGAHVNASTAVSSKLNAIEQPLDRLIKAVKSITHTTLTASVRDISSVVSMVDRIAGSAPGNGSRAAVGEDLVAMTKCRLHARNFFTQDGPSGMKRMRRSQSAMSSSAVSSVSSLHDSVKQLNGSDTYELVSTATSCIRRSRIEPNHALIEEIGEINRQLIETVVEIGDADVNPTAAAAAAEGGAGIIVNCSFSAVALSPNLKSKYGSAQMSPIQPLTLLIPTNYPSSSPILLDKCPVAASKEYDYLSMKAKSKFSVSLRTLSQPMSLSEMARTWDVCARAVVSEFAQQNGGGTFSSKYGSWESCLTTA